TLNSSELPVPIVADDENAAMHPGLQCFHTRDPRTGEWLGCFASDSDNFFEPLTMEQQRLLEPWSLLYKGTKVVKGVRFAIDGSPDLARTLSQARKDYEQPGYSKGLKPFSTVATSPVETLTEFMSQFSSPLKILREAGKRACCVWPRWLDKRSEVACYYYLQRALALDCVLQLDHHESEMAHQDLMAQLRFCGESYQFPVWMLKESTLSACRTTILTGLAARQWSDAQWKSVAGELASLDPADEIRKLLRNRRAYFAREYAIRPDSPDYDWCVGPRALGPFKFGPSGWVTRNQIAGSKITQEQIDSLTGAESPLFAKFLAVQPPRNSSPYEAIPASFWSFEQDRYKSLMEVYERLHLQEVAIALERYRLRFASYPETLRELVPEILPNLPRSHFNAKFPSYELLAGQTYKIWFYGFNGIDEHGLDNGPYGYDVGDFALSPPAALP
ncbi:MAG: hypothetical protein JWP97_6859, partial [Labilithrix sp.]|nr:hypothetical protein [Labilithrix sp.]